ncbi:Branched-chain amino acid transport system permease protein OS=Castellaniella defragrans OX=75697 GN=HNR28_000956 PE=3 SV=1 [Castellaniella defragrans]
MDLFLQFLVNGLVIGTFYALSAFGLTLILGFMKVVNFAHGELYMLGGVLGWWVTSKLGLDFFGGLVVVIVVMAAVGWLIDRVLIERIRHEGEEAGILLTIGLSVFIVNTALIVVGSTPLKVAGPVSSGPIFLGPVVITQTRVFAVLICALLMGVTHLVIDKTRLGRAMRATFQDPMAAQLAGIGIANIYACTFAIGTVIAATAGMLLSSIYSIQVSMGGLVTLKAFIVVILGGMGSFVGAIVGGLLLGVVEALWGGYVSTGWVDVIGFSIVILTLLFRPYGLFSKRAERA